MLGSNTSHYDVNAVPLKWVLPFERKTELHLNAIDLTFLGLGLAYL
jgi:hypothetical protein